MDLHTVQNNTLERLNRYRRLHSLITGELFIALFELSTDKDTALKYIEAGDLTSINTWITRQRRVILEYMSVADLRLECRLHGVQNYHLLQKEEMIQRIKERNDTVRKGKDSEDRVGAQIAQGTVGVGSV